MDGMSPSALRLCERRGQRRIAGRADGRELHREILQTIRRLQSGLQARRRIRLAGQQDVGVVLRVGREAEVHEAEVGVQHVAALDHARVRRRSGATPPLR